MAKKGGPSIKGMHIAFGIASVLMLLTTVYAFVQDHYGRGFPEYQAQYDEWERKRLKQELEEARDQLSEEDLEAEVETLKEKLGQANEQIKSHQSDIDEAKKEIATIDNSLQKNVRDWNSAKADLDVYKYQVDAGIRKLDDVTKKESEVKTLFESMKDLEKRRGVQQAKIAEIQREQTDTQKFIDKYEGIRKEVEIKLKKNIGNPIVDLVRDAPGINIVDPRRRIEQVVLTNLPVNVFFSNTQRVDRCVTCHKGIDNPSPMYDPKNVESDVPKVLRAHPNRELYVSPNSPHAYKQFGCTICHQGRGPGTDFNRAAHTPRDQKQAADWKKDYGWEEMHYWDAKMYPMQYVEASCLKCHKGVDSVPQAPTLNAGRELFRERGCVNCHMGTTGDKDMSWVGRVGPDLRRIGEKTNADWARHWIENPWSFRPSTKMPRFFGLENRKNDMLKIDDSENHVVRDPVEVEAIATYLFVASKLREVTPQDPPQGDAAAGKDLFSVVGCVACHATRELPKGEAFDVASHGPDLSRVGEKVNPGWLYNWLKNPRHYWAETKMPNMRLSDTEAANIAAYLLQNAKGKSHHEKLSTFPETAFDALIRDKLEPTTPKSEVDAMLADPTSLMVNSLKNKVRYINKKDSGDGEWTEAQIDAIKGYIAKLDSPQERSRITKAFYTGETLIQHHGCFGCHNIQGFTYAPLTCVNLAGEADKELEKFDFGKAPGDAVPRTKWDWFYTKISRPRVFDMGKLELIRPFDRLRMPWFGYKPVEKEGFDKGTHGDDHAGHDHAPGEGHGHDDHADYSPAGNSDPSSPFGFSETEVHALVTHLLSLTTEAPPKDMHHIASAKEVALDRGERVIRELNCTGCHVAGLSRGTLANLAPPPKTMPLQAFVALMSPSFRLAKPFYDEAPNRIYLNEDAYKLDFTPAKDQAGTHVEGLLNVNRGTYLTEETAPILMMEKLVRANPQTDPVQIGFSIRPMAAGSKAGWVPYGQLVSEAEFIKMTSGIFFKDDEVAAKAYSGLTKGDKPFHVNVDAYERLAGTLALQKKGDQGALSFLEIDRRRTNRQFYEPVNVQVRFGRGEGAYIDHIVSIEKSRGNENASEQNAPPKLNFQGGKVQPDWLYQFLNNVHPLRPGLNVRMPSFWTAGPFSAYKAIYPTGRQSAVDPYKRDKGIGGEPTPVSDAWQMKDLPDDAVEVVEFFTRDAGEKPYGYQRPHSTREQDATLYEKGRNLVFGKSGIGSGCVECHSVGQREQPEPKYAPNLAFTHNRLKSDWLRRFLIYPWSIHPKVNMPANFFNWAAYNGDFKDPKRGLQPDDAKFKEAAEALEAVHFYLMNAEGEFGAGAKSDAKPADVKK
jgi:cbb3-type cytochrome oxidase cytochrome c subunit